MPVARTRIPVLAETVKAAGVIPADRFVGGNAGAAVVPAAAATAMGVSDSSAVAGDYLSVTTLGVTVVTSGAAIVIGALVETDVQGRAITKAAGKALGRARTAASAADQLISVFLLPDNT